MMSRKGLKYLFRLIGKKLFRKEPWNEVEYGQTLSKKRRKNCILKSVSTLSESVDNHPEISDWVDVPYHIKFEFSSDEREFRGSVLNFQKIDPMDECCLRKCCEKCFCTMKSTRSVSSDSACEIASRSSCADYDCPYGRTSMRGSGSVEDFIRIHEHFLKDWVEEPSYETLPRPVEAKSECDYDILLSKTSCNVLEPSYENLKLVENFYETPKNMAASAAKLKHCSDNCAIKKIKDLVQANKTYDEVIDSLKVFHLSSEAGKSDAPEKCKCVAERGDNDINDYLESYKTYENDANNDVESVSFQY